MDDDDRTGEWERPGGDRADLPAYARGRSGSVTTEGPRPAAPQAPPSSWDEERDGPGSPAGSVRPPDTTGTVDAPSRPGRRGMATALLGALVGAVLGTAGTLTLARTAPQVIEQVQAPQVVQGEGDGRLTSVEAVAQAVTPSVVRIDRLVVQGGIAEPQGLGSGVIYRSDGYIVTNNHVVEGAEELEVKFADGESVTAEVVGTDPLTDLAVVRVERTGLPAINVRTEDPDVGEPAVAIGSPFGLDASVTAGVVSALNRSIEIPITTGGEQGFIPLTGVIQTDAAINPGNSGGALVDAEGRLIGINSAILSTTGPGQQAGNVGVGFAIPSDTMVTVVDTLIEDGVVRHARLGISGTDVTAAAIREFGLDVRTGALVATVEEGGPAAQAGVEPGDVIVSAGGETIETFDQLVAQIQAREPGETILLELVRGGERIEVEVTLGEFDL
ncbi:MAG: trypsin-like peptidase domain-containing protein [Actinobacteria bacterium]|nr:trypsin-like peptidase domain-containing protein [Actinomycetota bacterium]